MIFDEGSISTNARPIEFYADENGCHICTSHAKKKSGHIKIRRNNMDVEAHRYLFQLVKGNIPKGFVVRHMCDNPSCINLEHLELGTHSDNVRDRVERNRSAKGSMNGRSKITEEDVPVIYHSKNSIAELAREYSVDRKAIRSIKQRKTWKHVEV